MELIREQGTQAVSFRRIAAKLGRSYTTPYRVFESKEEIFIALRARAFARFGDALRDAIRGSDDPTERLRAMVAGYVRAALADSQSYRLMLDLNQGHSHSNDENDESAVRGELRAQKERALGYCRRVVADAVSSGELPAATDPNTAAHVFWASAHGLVSLALADQLVMGRSLEELIEPIATTLLAGMAATPIS